VLIKLLRNHLGPFKWLLVGIVFFQFLQTLGTLFLPTLNADIINNGVVTGNIRNIIVPGAIMLAVTLLLGICSIIAVYYSARTAMRFGRDVRASMFKKVQSFSLHEVNEF